VVFGDDQSRLRTGGAWPANVGLTDSFPPTMLTKTMCVTLASASLFALQNRLLGKLAVGDA